MRRLPRHPARRAFAATGSDSLQAEEDFRYRKENSESSENGALKRFEMFLNLLLSSFFENMNRIIAPLYVPTEADVLRVRLRTCGIVETHFQLNQMIFR